MSTHLYDSGVDGKIAEIQRLSNHGVSTKGTDFVMDRCQRPVQADLVDLAKPGRTYFIANVIALNDCESTYIECAIF